MSNSYRKTPISGITTSSSDKWYKTRWHKKERRKIRQLLQKGLFDLVNKLFYPFDDWETPKDGKTYFEELKAKDIKTYKKMMRK